MTISKALLMGAATAALALGAGPALAQDPPGEGLVMYMQMGGNAGDGATLARQTGAAQAAAALGVDLKEQFSAWAPETMINQFKEAVAANPNCIEIMGHPGSAAFQDLVKQARRPGHRRHHRQLADDRPAGPSSGRRASAMPASTSMPAAS